ncbi:MAG: DNA repair protein RecO [bacterium]|nr:DNA repair protein RecO [bacterium]
MQKLTRLSSKTYKVTGIVLGKKNFFETDRIIEIFTLEKGKVRAVVKGARKSSSKLAGSTELFTYGDFFLAKGKNLDIVTSVVSKNHFQKAAGNLKNISQLFLISEVLNKLLPADMPNESIFAETIKIFELINKNAKPELAYEYLYKTIVLFGYGLSLTSCSKCHEEIPEIQASKNIFNLESGGILCERCNSGDIINVELSKNTIKILRYIENHDIDKYSKVVLDDKTAAELLNLVTGYLNFIYQREFKSAKFIKNVKALK